MELSAVRTRRSREVTGHTPHSVAIVSPVDTYIVDIANYIRDSKIIMKHYIK